MRSRWNDTEAPVDDALAVRAYTSKLIGSDTRLVLHGGGNTSVKSPIVDRFGDAYMALWVKASGFDLAVMGVEGFTGLDLDAVARLAEIEDLTDAEMVNELLRARLDSAAATPSIEAIVHGLIPFTFVDHTHADAIVTVTNLPDGRNRLTEIFGERVLVLPYVKPGFVLARQFREVCRSLGDYDGVVLEHHGLFTYSDDAHASYESTIALVDEAARYLSDEFGAPMDVTLAEHDPISIARSRRRASALAGRAVISLPAGSIDAGSVESVASLLDGGPLTPEHVIHNKPFPVVVDDRGENGFDEFAERYREYFDRAGDPNLTMLPPYPHWALFKSGHVRSYGQNLKRARVSADVGATTLGAMFYAGRAGGWKGLDEFDLRDLEYWELEQSKLRRQAPPSTLTGKIAVVTGAASGIGRACAELLAQQGAVVVGLDIDGAVTELMNAPGFDGLEVDATDEVATAAALRRVVDTYGGIDIVVSTVGLFRTGDHVEVLDDKTWDLSLAVNLTSHRTLVKHAIPFLRQGVDPAIVFVGSRNVAAPGAGAAAYSVSKAGLTQLMRVLSLELAPDGIRVNAVHPDAVFDTGLWTDETLETSARRYGMTVGEYKTRNVLSAEVTSVDVAMATVALVNGTFAKTTGAQIPVDGGNDRVI
jgi:rhamnose utilization protein RhaD (predicted bifunctional aldolase and dehydrogenase)/NAD(P)-dependent dehydrogenase (short-subunit alcohol dehydrogenase family)